MNEREIADYSPREIQNICKEQDMCTNCIFFDEAFIQGHNCKVDLFVERLAEQASERSPGNWDLNPKGSLIDKFKPYTLDPQTKAELLGRKFTIKETGLFLSVTQVSDEYIESYTPGDFLRKAEWLEDYDNNGKVCGEERK